MNRVSMQLMKMAQSKGRNNNMMIKLGQKWSVKNMKNKRHVLEDG
jgi:hypothetical protein